MDFHERTFVWSDSLLTPPVVTTSERLRKTVPVLTIPISQEHETKFYLILEKSYTEVFSLVKKLFEMLVVHLFLR